MKRLINSMMIHLGQVQLMMIGRKLMSAWLNWKRSLLQQLMNKPAMENGMRWTCWVTMRRIWQRGSVRW